MRAVSRFLYPFRCPRLWPALAAALLLLVGTTRLTACLCAHPSAELHDCHRADGAERSGHDAHAHPAEPDAHAGQSGDTRATHARAKVAAKRTATCRPTHAGCHCLTLRVLAMAEVGSESYRPESLPDRSTANAWVAATRLGAVPVSPLLQGARHSRAPPAARRPTLVALKVLLLT